MKFVPIQKEHLSRIKKWRNEQTRILRQNKVLTDKDQQEWFKNINKGQVLFAMLEYGELIGYCGLTHLDQENKRAEITFLVATPRNKMRCFGNDFENAINFLCSYGFNILGLHKIFAEVFEYRKNVIKLLEENGFKKEGVLKDHIIKKEHHSHRNKFYDSIIMARLQK
jgi:RimJ/RimL family protein N-acetyltransferase